MSTLTLPHPLIPIEAYARPLLSPAITARLPERFYDVVVVGAGVAGLTFTLRLPPDWRVALLTKGALGESNTRYAQGGLSAAIGPDDSPALHEQDTEAAGAGLCDPVAVRRLVEGAPAAVRWLLALGTHFDRDAVTGELELGREAAHSRRRVLHAGGDATGAEIERTLVTAVRGRSTVEVYEEAFAVDLVVERGCCRGLVVELRPGAAMHLLRAPVVAVAAGGAGQLWATTSNPPGATGDGLALALRAGVAVADLEFVQFHPTVLALPGSAPFLITEAVRGEGAYLRSRDGERFMVAIHPLAELAPRDVVARGIHRQMARDGSDQVYLDLRHLNAEAIRARFPTISRELAARGLDLATDLIPVAPAAHYFIGGIAAATTGETSLPGLLALGEASCTGVHGANRLASNSLLEGLVFAIDAADRLIASGKRGEPRAEAISPLWEIPDALSVVDVDLERLAALRTAIQQSMSAHVAVVRDAAGLAVAANEVRRILDELVAQNALSREVWEVRNMALAASAVIDAAALREESRGAHFRSDFPESRAELNGCHLAYGGGVGWRYTSLAAARAGNGEAH